MIVVAGDLDERFRDAFADVSIHSVDGDTELTGSLRDQSQLQGVLRQLFDLGLDIVSISTSQIPLDARDLGG